MLVAVHELEDGPTPNAAASATLWEMSSDAAKDGTDRPALAGYMHGASWAILLRPEDVVEPLQIAIPVLELAAIVINFYIFGPRIPTGVRIVVMSDSLTSVDVLADGTARAPLMQWLHTRLLADEHFQRLMPLALIGHGYGETNVMGDARSRGYDDLVTRLCAALHVKHVALDAPPAAHALLGALRAEHRALLGVDGGKRPHDPQCEPEANSTKRRAIDPNGNGVRIGEASNPGPTPTPTPAAESSTRAQPLGAPGHTSTALGPSRASPAPETSAHDGTTSRRTLTALRCPTPPALPVVTNPADIKV